MSADYRREEDLCSDFSGSARSNGWRIYPETGGWDLLLVRGPVQVGVQAKLTASNHLLLQALEGDLAGTSGPAYRAVLFSRVSGRTPVSRSRNEKEFQQLCRHLRLLVLRPPRAGIRAWLNPWFNAVSRVRPEGAVIDFRHYRRRPPDPVWTPPFEPDLPAGVPNPRTVSAWALSAVALENVFRARGWVCLEDSRRIVAEIGGRFKPATLLARYFRCTAESAGSGRQRRWVLRPRVRPPSREFGGVLPGNGRGS